MSKDWIDLSDKVVIVTGGSSGIGETITADLLNCNAKVGMIDIQPPDEFPKNTSYFYQKADISDLNQVKKAVENIYDKFGRVDGLVNNAGVTRPRMLIDYYGEEPQYEIDEEDFYFMVDVNMKGTLFVSQVVGKIMIKQKKGVIVNVSSAAGVNGSRAHSVYAATKAAVNSYTLSWAKELAPYNIRVLDVAPGILERTPANDDEKYRAQAYGRGMDIDTPPEVFFKNYKSSIPLGRPGNLSEVSNVVNFLLSDHSSYLTGIIIPIAGGKIRN